MQWIHRKCSCKSFINDVLKLANFARARIIRLFFARITRAIFCNEFQEDEFDGTQLVDLNLWMHSGVLLYIAAINNIHRNLGCTPSWNSSKYERPAIFSLFRVHLTLSLLCASQRPH